MTSIDLDPRHAALVFDENGDIVETRFPDQDESDALAPASARAAAIFMASHTDEGRLLLQAVYDWFERATQEQPS